MTSQPNMAAYLCRLHHISLHVSNAEKVASDLVSKFKFNVFASRLAGGSRQLALRKGAAVFVVNDRPEWKRGAGGLPGGLPGELPGVNPGKHGRHQPPTRLYDVSLSFPVDTVSNVCFEVDDAGRSCRALKDMGCCVLVPPTRVGDEAGHVTYFVVKSIVGNVCHTLIDRTKYRGDFLPGFDVMGKHCSSEEEDTSCPITHFDHITYACPRKTTHQIMRWYEDLFGFQRFFIDR